VKAWEQAFADVPEVKVSRGDIFELRTDAIVSPANSFGFMDGGIDLLYSKYFGWGLQADLQALLAEQHYGELPVGQAVVVPTGHDSFAYLVSAPTMRVPSDISATVNVYLAFRAALIAVQSHNTQTKTPIRSLLAPGLGTGIGGVAPAAAARQMRLAYDAIIKKQSVETRGARAILRQHQEMLS
jgi:O-acetyl-ADP-ribose deacetylase (regulator of RNase III)